MAGETRVIPTPPVSRRWRFNFALLTWDLGDRDTTGFTPVEVQLEPTPLGTWRSGHHRLYAGGGSTSAYSGREAPMIQRSPGLKLKLHRHKAGGVQARAVGGA